MKQIDATIVTLKDSLRLTPPVKSSSAIAASIPPSKPIQPTKISQQDALKQRAQTLQKQLETLRAKTSADMRRAMSSTLGQSSLSFSNVLNESDNRTIQLNEQKQKQVTIKNINDLSRNELDEFLKKSGATKIQSGDTTNSLLVTYSSKSDVDKIQKDGLTFKDRNLEISFHEDPSLNTSLKKRTLSETMEDELLGGGGGTAAATETTNEDEDEPKAKRRNQSQTSDVDQNEQIEEIVDEEDQLLADNEKSANNSQTKNANQSIGSYDESNQQYEFEPNDLDDEVQLLDS
ncbi:unnamed protein product [Adineta steineri]|nr:unnamed protein product [Adineta steineri]